MKESLDEYSEAYNSEFKYALDNDLIIHEYAKRVSSRLKGSSLLELGIGHSYATGIFRPRVSRYVIVEGSGAIIRKFRSKSKVKDVEIVESYFEEYETTERFDNIIMGFILEHVDDPDFILERFKRFLSDEGRIFITAPNSDALNRRLGYEAGLIESLEWLSDSDRQLGHKRYLNLKKLEDLAAGKNLCVLAVEGLFLKPITTDQIKQLKFDRKILDAMMKAGTQYPELCAAILMELGHEK
jgi:SAM-dependent methyltransferase